MADGSSSNNSNNAIWVAVITVAGSLVSAVLVNSDKLFPHHDKTAVAATTPSAAAAPQSVAAALNASAPAGPAEKPQASAPAAAQTPVDKPAPAPAAQPASPGGADESAAQLEASAVDTVRQYYEAWSNPSDPQGRAVAQFFGPSVNFYGKQMSLQDVIADKMRFAQRWPERTYVIRPNSLQTECSPDTRSCRVAGTIDWRAVNNARAGHLSGSSTFTVVLNGGVIVAEDGRVLSRN